MYEFTELRTILYNNRSDSFIEQFFLVGLNLLHRYHKVLYSYLKCLFLEDEAVTEGFQEALSIGKERNIVELE